jgi:hypothetical protein
MLSCGACGAASPLFYNLEEDIIYIPISFERILQGIEQLPHLERYLGYSAHKSPEKDQVRNALLHSGAISQINCSDYICKKEYENWQLKLLEN